MNLFAEQDWQEVSVDDLLELGNVDGSRRLIGELIGPGGVQLVKGVSNAVVLSHPDGVLGSKHRVLVDTWISGFEARVLGHLVLLAASWQELSGNVLERRCLESTVLEGSQ